MPILLLARLIAIESEQSVIMTHKHVPYCGLHALLHKSLVSMRRGCDKQVSSEGYFLYSQLYLKYESFYRSLTISLDRIYETFNYSAQRLQEILEELKVFNLVRNCREKDEFLQLELIPPPPLSLMRGTILSKDEGYSRYLVLGDIFLVEGDEEFIPLKYHFLHLDTNECDQLIENMEIGDSIYFVAEAVQQRDSSWRLRNECNIMINYPRA